MSFSLTNYMLSLNDNKNIVTQNHDTIQKLHINDLNEAYATNDTTRMRDIMKGGNLHDRQSACGPAGIYIDKTLEDGNDKMAKFLVMEFRCQPSLYAKQMAHVNGHHKLAFWMDSFAELRNKTDISSVHYDNKTKQWNKSIPEEYRFKYE